MTKCIICRSECTYVDKYRGVDSCFIKCVQCGEYSITRTSLVGDQLKNLEERQRANISGWLIRNQQYEIHSENIVNLLNIKSPNFNERADALLTYISKISKNPGVSIPFSKEFISRCWCYNTEEVNVFLWFLKDLDRIEIDTPTVNPAYKIKPKGWIRLDEISQVNADSTQGFVAMWFDESMIEIYDNAIAPAINDAGYNPFKIDLEEHNEKICDEIIAQIRKSKFVVADFTKHRGGVYFEAGFAKGLGLDVFWLCHEDDFSERHFDIRQYNCIRWKQEEPDELRKRLAVRIESVLGHGPIH